MQMTENRIAGNAICNCCSCCCEMFRLIEHSGKQWILSPSRFLARVGEGCPTRGCGVTRSGSNRSARMKASAASISF
ncbi:MAG: hypothetical protein E4G96_05235 [Chrysiogenales bacterium]|nr:MAG: hypothetical protein E4G96_05235 [Chrysiogenales bacterium]